MCNLLRRAVYTFGDLSLPWPSRLGGKKSIIHTWLEISKKQKFMPWHNKTSSCLGYRNFIYEPGILFSGFQDRLFLNRQLRSYSTNNICKGKLLCHCKCRGGFCLTHTRLYSNSTRHMKSKTPLGRTYPKSLTSLPSQYVQRITTITSLSNDYPLTRITAAVLPGSSNGSP